MTWLWSKITGAASAVGIALSLLFVARLKGRSEGKAALQAEQDQKRAQARQVKKELDDEVDGLGHADVDERFGRWLRR
ncbi:hypothetical protein [Bosea robiniae]|uniref:ABC transporter permease n=1 Tax=Bosea robiniae TaxID=1036780 RepID=A0ABY0NFI3_9HYPH|nr:hypothetical protein [Bosea robiniae]SDF36684.1 hypothetical protein SAMN05421844_101441 [Bosea robiniae]